MAKAIFYGFSAPFINGNSVLPTQADERLIKNDLLQLLMTIPGERVMRPDYGTTLRNATFEQSDDILLDNIERSIKTAIQKYESRIIVDNLEVKREQDEHTISVKLYCRAVLINDGSFVVELKVPLGGSNLEAS